MANQNTPPLWVKRTQAQTQELYADWADSYDADVLEWGYVTPQRVATALARFVPLTDPVLDFGCGTGLSGKALAKAGFAHVDGTDVSPEMIAHVSGQDIYRNFWQSTPGTLDVTPGTYGGMTATGVISMGAAPADTMDMVLDTLAPGAHLALSYNDPTLEERSYMDKLAQVQSEGRAALVFEEHGPHLPAKGVESTVYVLKRL